MSLLPDFLQPKKVNADREARMERVNAPAPEGGTLSKGTRLTEAEKAAKQAALIQALRDRK